MKTNISYTATITDLGSSSAGSFFDEANVKSVLAGEGFGVCSAWGNAIQPSAVIAKANDSSPTTSSVLSAISSTYSSLTVDKDLSLLFGTQYSIGFDFGSATTIDAIRILYSGAAAGISRSLTNPGTGSFSVYKSSDNSTWTLVSSEAMTKSLSKGEHVFSFSAQTARYFKVNASIAPMFDLSGNGYGSFSSHNLYIHRIFGINTSIGANVSFLVDTGHAYKLSRFMMKTFCLRKDRDNLVIRSSADNITYGSNQATFGASSTSLASAPVNGELLFSRKDRAIYLVGTNIANLYKYDFETNAWSTISTGLPTTSATFRSAIDINTNTIFMYGNGTQLYQYTPTSGIGARLSDGPYSMTSYSSITIGNGKLWVNIGIVGYDNYATYNGLEWMVLTYDIYTGIWNPVIVTPLRTSGASGFNEEWTKGIQSLLYVNNSYVDSSPVILVANFSDSSVLGKMQLFTSQTSDVLSHYTNFGPVWVWNGMRIYNCTTTVSANQRCSLAFDTDKAILYKLGNLSGSGVSRHFDTFFDFKNRNWYLYPGKDATSSGGDTYAFGGTSSATYIVYVPEIRKVFKLGVEDTTGSSTTFRSYDVEQINQIKATLTSGDRYVKVENTSQYSWPYIVQSISVIGETTDFEFKQNSNHAYGMDIDYDPGVDGSTYQFDIHNSSLFTTNSGTVYIEPDGSEASRYMRICTTSSGTFVSHCVHNDLDNFQCSASNTNYSTSYCGKPCTSGTGSAGYETDFLTIGTLTPDAYQPVYVKSAVPTNSTITDRLGRIIVELD